MNLLLLRYNNYYNRRVKKEETLDNYRDAADVIYPGTESETICYTTFTSINFQEGDLVDTQIVLNWDKDWEADYIVCYEGNWNDSDIQHRWFILDSVRTRKGQYTFTLRRDILVDDYQSIQNSIFNVDRCILSDSNPLIYNHEPFSYNQIKTKEIPIYDQTGCAWIVGYMANNFAGLSREFTLTTEKYDIDKSDINHDEWVYYSKLGTVSGNPVITEHTIWFGYAHSWWEGGYGGGPITTTRNYSTAGTDYANIGTNNENIRVSESKYSSLRKTNMSDWYNWTALNETLRLENSYADSTDISNLRNYNGKKILFKDGIYSIRFSFTSSQTISKGYYKEGMSPPHQYDTGTTAQAICNTASSRADGSIKHKGCDYVYTLDNYTFNMIKVSQANKLGYEIPTTANSLIDSPYKMFCIPYPVISKNSNKVIINGTTISGEIMFRVVMDIIKNTITSGDNANLYDVQILPYCPLEFSGSSYSTDAGTRYLYNRGEWTEGIDYTKITYDLESSEIVKGTYGYIYFPTESNFKFTIDKINNTSLSSKFPLTNVKIQNETELLRLCASNYSSAFDFNLAKNGGLKAINVYCTYKPFNPYIQLSPDFQNLYGANYDDARGLICEGDYSMPIVNSQWISYELNNKTYQQAFNREISHMEVSQDIAKQNQLAKSITGTITGATSGATTGAMVGGGYGAIAGAAIGGTASAIGGVMDYNNLKRQQGEDINYAKDMFNFNLQNIQALPTVLSKTSAIVANTKYVPFIEVYDATDEEKQVLQDYITYQGMTAGYVGNITSTGFVKANIIRYSGDKQPHEVNAFNNELLKGVYLE